MLVDTMLEQVYSTTLFFGIRLNRGLHGMTTSTLLPEYCPVQRSGTDDSVLRSDLPTSFFVGRGGGANNKFMRVFILQNEGV